MYIDIAPNSRMLTDDDIRETLFAGVKKRVNGISVLPQFLPAIKDFVPDGMDLGCFVDYPYGSSDTSVRSHAALTSIRKGASNLDLLANCSLLINRKYGRFYEDIEAILNLALQHKTVIRLVLEYRLFEYKTVLEIGNVVREMGIEYIIPSSGSQVDSWDDNLAISVELSRKSNINVITNGGVRTKKQFDTIVESNVFGVRFFSHKVAEDILIGV